jgi:hypothetical protein
MIKISTLILAASIAALPIASAYSETAYQAAISADLRSLEKQQVDIYRQAQAAESMGVFQMREM